MKLGERLYNYRKKVGISQEDMASKLNVTRQTVSKWETDQTLPDLDKIESICELFNISTDELLKGKKEEVNTLNITENKKQKALVISGSILLYFIAIIWIILSATFLNINEGIMVSIFMLIIGISTVNIVYYFISNSNMKKAKEKKKTENKKLNTIIEITSLVFLILYLGISFITFAWHITWIMWLIYALAVSIIKLIFNEESKKDE
jgi:transcriptional regulator with XRE-family HTH domain